MKASLLITAIILAAGGLLGWKQQVRLATARGDHQAVSAEAAALGLSPGEIAAAGKPPLATKTGRIDSSAGKLAAARDFARELIDFAKEMKEHEKSGQPPDEALQARIMTTLRKFMDLGPEEIKVVIEELRDHPDVDDEMRRGIVGFAVMMMSNEQPESALTLFTESADLVKLDGMAEHVVASALGKLAERDPFAAIDWIRKNSEKHGKLITDQARSAILASALRQDPKSGLGLIKDLGFKDDHSVLQGISGAVRTPEERDALLGVLRADPTQKGRLKETLSSIGGQLSAEGFESSQTWLSSAKLSQEDLDTVVGSINAWNAKSDSGRWIEWMEGKTSGEVLERKTNELVSQWTRQDYKAAGEWIGTLSPGAARTAAIKSYAETVAPYEPEAAEQWANSLPAGKEREELLLKIQSEKKTESVEDAVKAAE